jgi:cytochrome c553
MKKLLTTGFTVGAMFVARTGAKVGAILAAAAFFALGAQAADVLVGDPEAGKQKAVTCGACHGADGNSMVPTFPKLAGLGEKYLLRQTQYIRDGVRPVAAMAGQVDNMSDQDLADIAAYYTSLTRSVEKADPEKVELGQTIYRAGIKERNVAACIACHGARGGGNGPAGFPAIGGQHADYVAAQLKAYRLGYESPEGRVTGGETMIMRSNAFGLTDIEIEALAAYVSGLN